MSVSTSSNRSHRSDRSDSPSLSDRSDYSDNSSLPPSHINIDCSDMYRVGRFTFRSTAARRHVGCYSVSKPHVFIENGLRAIKKSKKSSRYFLRSTPARLGQLDTAELGVFHSIDYSSSLRGGGLRTQVKKFAKKVKKDAAKIKVSLL